MTGFTGGCLCRAVRYEASAEPGMMGHCYCEDCRRSSGTTHCSHLVVPEAALKVTGTAAGYKRPSDSGSMVERSFCPTCGSALWSRNANMPGMVFLRASSLDDMEVFKPQMVVYASRAPSWGKLDPSLPTFAVMPPRGP